MEKMFRTLKKIIREGGLDKIRKRYGHDNGSVLDGPYYSYYDKNNDTVYGHFNKELGNGEVEYRTWQKTIPEIYEQSLYREWKRNKRKIERELAEKPDNPSRDKVIDDVVAILNKIIDDFYSIPPDDELDFIHLHLKSVAKDLESLASPYHDISFDKYIYRRDKRGNPEMKKNEKVNSTLLRKIVKRANDLIEDEPDYYLPDREGSYMSNSLKGILADEFNISETTVYRNLKEKCIKKDPLFIVKIGY